MLIQTPWDERGVLIGSVHGRRKRNNRNHPCRAARLGGRERGGAFRQAGGGMVGPEGYVGDEVFADGVS